MFQTGVRVAIDVERLPVHIARTAQRKMQHARGNRRIADLIDQNEAAELAAFLIGLEHQGLVRGQIRDANGIEAQRLCGKVFHRVDVDLILRAVDGRGRELRRELQPIRSTGQQFLIGHPHQRRFELIRHFGRILRGGKHIAATAVQLVGQGERDGLSRDRLLKIRILSDDSRDSRRSARWQHAHRIARSNPSLRDKARETAEIQIGTVDPLNRHAKRPPLRPRSVDGNGLEIRDQRWARIPGRVAGGGGNVVSGKT